MPIRPLEWRLFTGGIWTKGPRENNPEGTLRRAKSVYPLRTGSIRSRSGIFQLAALNAHSLFKFAGNRIAGVGTAIHREVVGVWTLLAGVTTSGANITFMAAPPTATKEDYVFMAGSGNSTGTKLQKLNPALSAASQWALDRPSDTKASAVAGTLQTRVIDEFNAIAGFAFTTVDDDDTDVTATFPNNPANVAKQAAGGAGSIRFKVPKDKIVHADKLIVVDLDTFPGPVDSADEDYIEFYVAFSRPKHIKNMELTFYVGAGAPTFNDESDTYKREFSFQLVNRKKKKQLRGTGDLLRPKDVRDALITGRTDKVDFSMAEFVSEDKVAVTRRTWTRITIPKAAFQANGQAGTTGFTWANVQAIRVSVETTKQGLSRVWIDRMRMIGGAGMQGDYQYMFTFLNNNTGTRSNPSPKIADTNGDIIYDPVIIRNIERNGVDLGTTTALPKPTDTQVTHIEIWRTVGNGTAFFFAAKQARTSADAPGVNESYTDRIADYPGMFSGSASTHFLQPDELPDDNDRPEDTLADAVSFIARTWLTRDAHPSVKVNKNRVWYSPVGRQEVVQNFVPVGSTDEECQKLIVWNETLFCFTKRFLYRLLGTDEPFVFVQVLGAPGSPFPFTVKATDGGIIYQARDGMRVFDGNQSVMLADDALAPVFRGGTSDGIAAFSGVACEWGRDEYYVSDTNTTLAYSPSGGWRNVGVPCKAFFWEVDSRVLLASPTISGTTRIASFEGDTSGEQGGLVAEATNDVLTGFLSSDFEVETGGVSKGAGLWGIAQRVYILAQTEAQALTVSLIIDNTAVSLGTVSLTAGVKRMMEVAVQRAGFIQGVRLTAAAGTIASRIEITSIQVDVYTPDRPGE